MPQGRFTINGETYAVRYTSGNAAQGGRRGITLKTRPAQQGDPTRQRSARWRLSGPAGFEREVGGYLGCAWSENLWGLEDGRLLPAPASVALDLSIQDPASAGSSVLDDPEAVLDAFTLDAPFASSPTTHIIEDRGLISFARSTLESFVSAASLAFSATVQHASTIRGSVQWYGSGWLSFGTQKRVQRRNTVPIGASPSYVDAPAEVYAFDMERGEDELAYIKADVASGFANEIATLRDAFLSPSNSFRVGDPAVPATSIGALGASYLVGSEVGAFVFRPDGRPFNVGRQFTSLRHADNGKVQDQFAGWDYITMIRGLYAYQAPSLFNPVGIESVTSFERFLGAPVYVHTVADALYVAYPGGYLLRGEFNAQFTPQTGLLDWYPIRRFADDVSCMGSTATPTNPTFIATHGDTAEFITLGRTARDLTDPNWRYHTGGGTWWGTKLARTAGRRGYMRAAYLSARNVDLASYWTLTVDLDEQADYLPVGEPINRGGLAIRRPTNVDAPDGRFVFERTLQPMLTLVSGGAGANVTPPELLGDLEIVYDEIADQVIDAAVALQFEEGDRSVGQQLRELWDLVGVGYPVPVLVGLPDDLDGDVRYGHVVSIERLEDASGTLIGAFIQATLWEPDRAEV